MLSVSSVSSFHFFRERGRERERERERESRDFHHHVQRKDVPNSIKHHHHFDDV